MGQSCRIQESEAMKFIIIILIFILLIFVLLRYIFVWSAQKHWIDAHNETVEEFKRIKHDR